MLRSPVDKPFLIVVNEEDRPKDTQALKRQPLTEGIDEAWLQELLQAQPALLPVVSIDERIQEPLTSLGCEIGTATGPIDNLLISQNGYLVVVETKLWRNAEARRKIVAQILDYAIQLRRWDHSKLEAQWRKQAGIKGSLWAHVRPEDYDEPEWIDVVNENLSLGRMTLLIVGDGIRSEASELVEAVSGHPDFQFRLGMVELRLYRMEDGRVMAIPTTIAKTQEIQRAVVRIERAAGADTPVTVETPTDEGETPRVVSVLTEEAFLSQVRSGGPQGPKNVEVARRLLKLLHNSDFLVDWQRASFSVKYPDPSGSGTMFSLASGYKNGQLACWTSILAPQLVRALGDDAAAKSVLDAHVRRLREFGATGKADISVEMALLDGKEQEVVEWLESTVAAIQEAARDLPPGED